MRKDGREGKAECWDVEVLEVRGESELVEDVVFVCLDDEEDAEWQSWSAF